MYMYISYIHIYTYTYLYMYVHKYVLFTSERSSPRSSHTPLSFLQCTHWTRGGEGGGTSGKVSHVGQGRFICANTIHVGANIIINII
jgi:hypothetical protein